MAHHESHRLAFFFPRARVLSEAEIASLPEEKRRSAARGGTPGVWLEVHCPGGACVGADGRIALEAAGVEPAKAKGVWLNVFCPEDSCLWKSGTETV